MGRRLWFGIGCCALIGCSGGDAPPPPEQDAAPQEARFLSRDFSFEGPAEIESGMVTLVLENEGETFHHLQLVRLEDGRSAEDFAAAFASMRPGDPLPEWAEPAGGVNPPDPGGEARATLLVEPGEYAVVCVVDTPDHVPHIAKGMVRALTVTASGEQPAAPPATTLDLTLTDYAFGFSAPPTAGRHVIRVRNAGPQGHEIALFRLHDGRTLEDLMAWAQTYAGEPPADAVGGAAELALGQVAHVPVDLVPGTYVALCFVPDSGDGLPHVAHGMVLPFEVS